MQTTKSRPLSLQLKNDLASYHLLNHPFYQAWMSGSLSIPTLKNYAIQYAPHVEAFPRYVSTVHGFCENKNARRMLLENLMDEEGVGGGKDHPQLWREFGEGLGVSEGEWMTSPVGARAKVLVDTFWSLCRSSYAEGLAALYAYEYQVPEIAKAKIEGLIQNYKIDDAKTLAFFAIHESADKFHSEACAQMLDEIPDDQKELARQAGIRASQALWDFLSEVHGNQTVGETCHNTLN